ncbi:MAG: MopE-related protein [Bacteroidota bacterium]
MKEFRFDLIKKWMSLMVVSIIATTGFAQIDNNAPGCSLGLAIPDNSCPGLDATIAVSGEAGTQLGTDIELVQLDLIISHTWNSQLDIRLMSPNGVIIDISTDRGGFGDNYGNPGDCPNTTASFRMDASSIPPGGTSNISGIFLPEGGDFASFNDGSDPNGTWTLQVCDDRNNTTGALQYAKLTFGAPCPPVAPLTQVLFDDTHCYGEASNLIRRLQVGPNTVPAAGEEIVWRFLDFSGGPGSDPSDYSPGDEFTLGENNDEFRIVNAGRSFRPQQFATGANGGPIYGTYELEVFVRNIASGCTSPAFGPVTKTIGEIPPTPIPVIQNNSFCYGDPNANSALEGVLSLTNVFEGYRIVWELTGKPANSDYNIGDEFGTNGCFNFLENHGELSTIVLFLPPSGGLFINSNAPVNGNGEPIIGTYEFTAYAESCVTDCRSNGAGPFTITILDPLPEPTCPDAITVECGDSLDPMATGEPNAPTNSCCPNAPMVTFLDMATPGTCPIIETIEREFTIEYDCGLMTTCTQTITVEDTTPPIIITCPDDQTLEWPAGFNTDPVPPNTAQDPSIDESNYPNIVYSEPCSDVTIDYQDELIGPSPGDCPNLWVVERTWTVTDECGLEGKCVQTFTFTDTTDPVIDCPSDPAPIEWTAGFNTDQVAPDTPQDPSVDPGQYGMATATDNCGTPAISYADTLYGPTPGNCPNLWILERTWSATDLCGLVTTCVQTFTFTDTTPPSINCPAGFSVECEADVPSCDPHDASASDNCGEPMVTCDQGLLMGGACGGTVINTYTATDACGLTATCTQVITVSDGTPPTVECMDFTINLDANGEYNLQPSEVFDAASSSDNCSAALTPVSVSQSYFSCLDEGANTVTLTVEDDCGNPSTCTAEVTVNEFITNISVVPTDESCAGAGDGQILASATADGGQLKYSIDGGANFELDGLFTNLTPGTYTVIIKVFGIPAVCEKTTTVTINAGGTELTCYLDGDGDGYGSANDAPVTACECPADYFTSADLNGNTDNDCNDSDPSINPAAAEVCDGVDNDCDGILLAGEVDGDGDGVFECNGDCDDGDATVYPGATEVCDGVDNNCNGVIDEGVGGQTFVGNVFFSTQAQVDAWLACYNKIQGSMSIIGSNIDDLGPLSNLEEITGNVQIVSNAALTSLNGLQNIATVGGSWFMYYNFQLADCCAIDDLLEAGGVGGIVQIFFNAFGSHCNSEAAIKAACPLAPKIVNPNSSTSISGQSFSVAEKQISLMPNPASSEVTIQVNRNAELAKLQIVDMLGRTVFIQHLENGIDRITIDLNNGLFENGLYLVTVLEEGEMITEQLVIKK